MLRWHGHVTQRRGGKLREPIIGESFSGIEEIADSLLREAVQNSLDARLDVSQPVRVRLYVSGDDGALGRTEADRWFSDAWQHFSADDILRNPDRRMPCRFVVVEDFNTKGLTGDVAAATSTRDAPNPWCLFFRKEGQSQKSAEDRGRWGVGKVVFPLSSDVHAFLGATVRADDGSRYVMGQAMLRSREVSGTSYDPDLWFCEMEADGFELPSEDPQLYARLRNDFHLERDDEPGLSIVVPYSDAEITRTGLVQAAIREFFYPILNRMLVVEIDAPGEARLTLDAGSITRRAQEFVAESHPDVLRIVEMAAWALDQESTPPITTAPEGRGALRWDKSLLDEQTVAELKSSLEQQQNVAVRIATRVICQQGPDQDTFFDVILCRAADTGLRRPVFVRSGLVIPEVKGPQVRGYHALVIAKDGPICTMLGDSENPAHTDWVKNSSNFKGKYKFAPSQLDYVKHAPSNVCNTLSQADTVVHRTALIDIFSLADDSDVSAGRRTKPATKGATPPTAPPLPPSTPKPFALSTVAGGVVVRSTATPLSPDKRLEIAFAYDLRSGDPLAKYHPADFRLKELPRSIEGAASESILDNILVIRATQPEFRIEVTGFDRNRDLFVRVREREAVS